MSIKNNTKSDNIFTIVMFISKLCGIIIAILLLSQSIFNIINVDEDKFTDTYRLLLGAFGFLCLLAFDKLYEFAQTIRDTNRTGRNIEEIIGAYNSETSNVFDRIEKLDKTVSVSFNVEKIPSLRQASNQILSKIRVSNKVRNTFLGTYTSDTEDLIIEAYNDFLSKKGRSWHDVLTLAELYSDRYKRVNPQNYVVGRHVATVLRHSMPVVNFIILDYEDEDKTEVFWGWVEADKSASGSIASVFRSTDEAIVSMFCDLFSALSTQKVQAKVYPDFKLKGEYERFNAKSEGPIINREGTWYTNAYGPMESAFSQKTVSHACFKILYYGGKPQIKGRLCEFEPGLKRHYHPITHQDGVRIDSSEHRILIQYPVRRGDNIRIGYIVYEFKEFDGREVIIGIYTNPFIGRIFNIFGFKINEKIDSNISNMKMTNLYNKYSKEIEKVYKTYHSSNIINDKYK